MGEKLAFKYNIASFAEQMLHLGVSYLILNEVGTTLSFSLSFLTVKETEA